MSGKAVAGSVILTLVIVAGAGYFLLPMAYPGLKGKNVVVQQKYTDFYNWAYIFDTNTSTTTLMNGTEMSITTQGGTSLFVQFDTVFQVGYQLSAFQGYTFNVTLGIDGVGKKNVYLQTLNGEASTHTITEQVPFMMSYATGVLPSGTYHVVISWYSLYAEGGSDYAYVAANYAFGAPTPTGTFAFNYNNSRTLLVQEITG